MIKLHTPLTKDKIENLTKGDKVLISGTIYTARDQAHKRIVDTIERGEKPPFSIENSVIFYVGPSPAKPGEAIGSAGPTTSYRMDPYAPYLLDRGLSGMIGKGVRSEEVTDSIKKNKAVYFIAVGGAGALLSSRVKKAKVIAYEDLGPEAVHELEIEDFPCYVWIV